MSEIWSHWFSGGHCQEQYNMLINIRQMIVCATAVKMIKFNIQNSIRAITMIEIAMDSSPTPLHLRQGDGKIQPNVNLLICLMDDVDLQYPTFGQYMMLTISQVDYFTVSMMLTISHAIICELLLLCHAAHTWIGGRHTKFETIFLALTLLRNFRERCQTILGTKFEAVSKISEPEKMSQILSETFSECILHPFVSVRWRDTQMY